MANQGDHCKYAKEFMKAGVEVYSCRSVADKIQGVHQLNVGETYSMGQFRVTPFAVKHDCEDYGYLIFHPEVGTIFFATDCYNLDFVIKGVNIFLAECNYSDELLDKAVQEGKTPRSQADRVRLSHMSMGHCMVWLDECEAWRTAHQIILIHGSPRHLNPEQAVSKFQQVLGVPTFYAKSGMVINLM